MRIALACTVTVCVLTSLSGSASTDGTTRGALQELWTGIQGEQVEALTASAHYGQPADEVRMLDALSCTIYQNNSGCRLSAVLEPPVSGEYTFWLASDDGGELWLGTNGSAATLVQIARVDLYTDPLDWQKEPGQKSAPITLEKGRKYALRALQKQGGGDAHVAVGWRGPGIDAITVIPGACLAMPPLSDAMMQRMAEAAQRDKEMNALKDRVIGMIESGTVLPSSLTMTLRAMAPQPAPTNDTGINVLLDQAHQTSFAILWGFKGKVGDQGYRCCTSIAALDAVLKKGGCSRIRLGAFGCEPFAWYPNPTFNVVITTQGDTEAQPYTKAEIETLELFVKMGGGLLIVPGLPRKDKADAWSMNNLLGTFGAKVAGEAVTVQGSRCPVLTLDAHWKGMTTNDGAVVQAGRTLGKGRIMVWSSFSFINQDDKDTSTAKKRTLNATLQWLAAGSVPAGGEWNLGGAGGVGIFPENEQQLGTVRVLYSSNQPKRVLDCITKDMLEASKKVVEWLPTPLQREPYYMVICAGGGGGWAIGGRPLAAAVIEYDPLPILGVFGHEMAHTLDGPPNDKGTYAGQSPHVNRGESHAGWFQGKIGAWFGEGSNTANRGCNGVLDLEQKKGAKIDLAKFDQEKFGHGANWHKEWYIYSKLDDAYGPTWYPRWYWVRSTRWINEPSHKESWDEMVEDISIAVGEDLFPFFRKVGTTLARERMGKITFNGAVLNLPAATIADGPANPVHLEAIGDYKKPLKKLP